MKRQLTTNAPKQRVPKPNKKKAAKSNDEKDFLDPFSGPIKVRNYNK